MTLRNREWMLIGWQWRQGFLSHLNKCNIPKIHLRFASLLHNPLTESILYPLIKSYPNKCQKNMRLAWGLRVTSKYYVQPHIKKCNAINVIHIVFKVNGLNFDCVFFYFLVIGLFSDSSWLLSQPCRSSVISLGTCKWQMA